MPVGLADVGPREHEDVGQDGEEVVKGQAGGRGVIIRPHKPTIPKYAHCPNKIFVVQAQAHTFTIYY